MMANDLCDICKLCDERKTVPFPFINTEYRNICGICIYVNANNIKSNLEPIKKDSMPNKLTPLDMLIIFSVACHGRPLSIPGCDSLILQEEKRAMFKLIELRIVVHSGDMRDSDYELTEGGKLLVEALCSMPLPVQKWVMPEKSKQ